MAGIWKGKGFRVMGDLDDSCVALRMYTVGGDGVMVLELRLCLGSMFSGDLRAGEGDVDCMLGFLKILRNMAWIIGGLQFLGKGEIIGSGLVIGSVCVQ